MKIAFYDSGIGGLTVFNQALRHFPNSDYIYFADSHNAPYGSKSQSEVEGFIFDAIDFLASKNIDVLVLACHTVSKMMLEKLRNHYPFAIIGMHSGLVESKSLGNMHAKLICTTDLSLKLWREYMSKKPIPAKFISLQKLVVFAESKAFNTPPVYEYLIRKLTKVDWSQFDSLVLGCTHFPFFSNQLRKIIPDYIKIVDGGMATALQLNNLISSADRFQGSGNIEYYISKTREKAAFFSRYFQVMNPIESTFLETDIKKRNSKYSFTNKQKSNNSISLFEEMSNN